MYFQNIVSMYFLSIIAFCQRIILHKQEQMYTLSPADVLNDKVGLMYWQYGIQGAYCTLYEETIYGYLELLFETIMRIIQIVQYICRLYSISEYLL